MNETEILREALKSLALYSRESVVSIFQRRGERVDFPATGWTIPGVGFYDEPADQLRWE
jgi:hypothetical protein